MVRLPRHDPDAEVVGAALAVDAVVEVAVVAAAAVFDHRAEKEFSLAVRKLAGEAHVQPEALRIDMGAAFRPQAGAAEGRKGSKAADGLRARSVFRVLRHFNRDGVRRLRKALGGQHIRPRVDKGGGGRLGLHDGFRVFRRFSAIVHLRQFGINIVVVAGDGHLIRVSDADGNVESLVLLDGRPTRQSGGVQQCYFVALLQIRQPALRHDANVRVRDVCLARDGKHFVVGRHVLGKIKIERLEIAHTSRSHALGGHVQRIARGRRAVAARDMRDVDCRQDIDVVARGVATVRSDTALYHGRFGKIRIAGNGDDIVRGVAFFALAADDIAVHRAAFDSNRIAYGVPCANVRIKVVTNLASDNLGLDRASLDNNFIFYRVA